MKRERVELIKEVLIIIVLSIVILITILNILSVVKNTNKKAFMQDTQTALRIINIERTQNPKFDPTKVSVITLKELFNISNLNYESVTITLITDKLHITVIGKGKWRGMTACGTIDNIVVVEGTTGCI